MSCHCHLPYTLVAHKEFKGLDVKMELDFWGITKR